MIYLANARSTDDRKQTLSLLMLVNIYMTCYFYMCIRLAVSSLVMVYMQNPSPMSET